MADLTKNFRLNKRALEALLIVVCTAVLIIISRLETRLFEISQAMASNKEFVNTVVYFALININVIFVVALSFLVFRNIAKIILERRRGFFGSKLKNKLIISFVLFAVAPTSIIFYVSATFITIRFENWFSEKIKTNIEQIRDVGNEVYEKAQSRLENIALFAHQRVNIDLPMDYFSIDDIRFDTTALKGFVDKFDIDGIYLYSIDEKLIWSDKMPESIDPETDKIFEYFINQSSENYTHVFKGDNFDIVQSAVPIRHVFQGNIIGVLIVQEHFEFQIIASIEKIIGSFDALRPGAEIIKMSFLILLLAMTLIVIFAAIWLGFYIARNITDPVRLLASATKEVALGNYNVNVMAKSSDETGFLISSFNKMTHDLEKQRKSVIAAEQDLKKINTELETRTEYIEIILKNISAGVISLDANNRITSVNSAAEKLLKIDARRLIGNKFGDAVRETLKEEFFNVILSRLELREKINTQLQLENIGVEEDLIVDATRIFDQSKRNMGVVIVFDDASKKLKAGRVAAWREVARRIAHEIKNPLTPIKLNSERLLRRYHDKFTGMDQEVFANCIENILAQVDSLRGLVNEFSKFSRLPDIKPTKNNINALIEEVIQPYKMSYANIEFSLDRLEKVPDIMVDKEQIRRVIINIVTNAISAFKENQSDSKISFRTQHLRSTQSVRLEICDNGIGIPKALVNRVLEPYFSTKDEGTGLGLAIVNQIVSDHNGYLRIRQGLPTGTCIAIDLPV